MPREQGNKHVSPVGWYYASYLLRFVELDDGRRDEAGRRFISWENTVIVEASSAARAYAKVEKIGRAASKPYRGGANGVRVRWEYLGITEFLPIHEQIADGAEIAWLERAPRTLRKLRQLVRPRSAFLS